MGLPDESDVLIGLAAPLVVVSESALIATSRTMRGRFPLSSFGGEGWGEEALAGSRDYRPKITSGGILLQPSSMEGRAQRGCDPMAEREHNRWG